MSTPRTTKALGCAALALGLAACGGGEVSGTLSGLGTDRSVVLLNNGDDALTLTSNGSFAFTTMLDAGDTYSVTVQTQPAGQVCTVSNGSGTINSDGDSVTDVSVTCTYSSSVRGTVSGLYSGVAVTLLNGSSTVAVTANGAFAFSPSLSDGTAYNVTVLTQPYGQTCTVSNGSGTFYADTFEDVVVNCQ